MSVGTFPFNLSGIHNDTNKKDYFLWLFWELLFSFKISKTNRSTTTIISILKYTFLCLGSKLVPNKTFIIKSSSLLS